MKHARLLTSLVFIAVLSSCDGNDLSLDIPIDSSPQLVLRSPDSDTRNFGNSIAIKGNLLLVSGFDADDTGRIYAFEWNGSEANYLNRIDAPETSVGSAEFARKMIICDNSAFVAAPITGQTLLYRLDGSEISWIGSFRPTPLRPIDGDFPSNMACTDDTLVLTSSGYHGPFGIKDSGGAFFYRNISGNWLRSTVLSPPDPREGDEFGISIDMTENVLAIGARGDGDRYPEGAVHTFSKIERQWDYEATISIDDLVSSNRFAGELRVFNDQIAVGAIGSTFGNPPGQIHLFSRQGDDWTNDSHILAANDETIHFGGSFQIDQDNHLLARETNIDGSYSIIVYSQINGNSKSLIKAFASPSKKETPEFGTSFENAGNLVFVSDPSKGEVYVYGK